MLSSKYIFNDYQLHLTEGYSVDEFFEDYRLVMAYEHWQSNKLKTGERRVTEENVRKDWTRYIALSKFARTRRPIAQEEIRRRVVDKLDFVSKNKTVDDLLNGISVLTVIGEGTWMDLKLLEGDRMYVGRLEREANLPLCWVVFSYNKTDSYMRLHAWSRSLMTDLLYQTYFENEQAPRGVGALLLSKLFSITGARILYTTPYPVTTHILARLMNLDEVHTDWQVPLPEGNIHGEKFQIVIRDEMREAWRKEMPVIDLTQCIRCGAPDAGFYLAHLGQGVRFCGACPPLASRTASAQGLLGQ